MANSPASTRVVRVGTRGSALARRQTELVIEQLRACAPDVAFSVDVIRTAGDASQGSDANQFEGQGVFVRAIEEALLHGDIDLAVHSSKDMPSSLPSGLTIGAFPQRSDPRDVLVSRQGWRLADLPARARVGTGSPRRRALLLDLRPDLEIVPIRGNVDTRVRRAREDLDATVVAAAGLVRLGREDEVAEYLDPARFIPAIGQGILALEVRADDEWLLALTGAIDDAASRTCAIAERATAIRVGAGCLSAIGAYAQIEGAELRLDAFLASEGELRRTAARGSVDDARGIGEQAGDWLMDHLTLGDRAGEPETGE